MVEGHSDAEGPPRASPSLTNHYGPTRVSQALVGPPGSIHGPPEGLPPPVGPLLI